VRIDKDITGIRDATMSARSMSAGGKVYSYGLVNYITHTVAG
jgi:hypothetical protein